MNPLVVLVSLSHNRKKKKGVKKRKKKNNARPNAGLLLMFLFIFPLPCMHDPRDPAQNNGHPHETRQEKSRTEDRMVKTKGSFESAVQPASFASDHAHERRRENENNRAQSTPSVQTMTIPHPPLPATPPPSFSLSTLLSSSQARPTAGSMNLFQPFNISTSVPRSRPFMRSTSRHSPHSRTAQCAHVKRGAASATWHAWHASGWSSLREGTKR